MKTISDHIRDGLLRRVGVEDDLNRFGLANWLSMRGSEWVPEFERLMRNRLLMGACRYGSLKEKGADGVVFDYIGDVRRRIKMYEDTGNLECLVDAANELMLEFAFGKHPMRCFESADDGEHCREIEKR